jgi:pyruvate dehydrogenase E1 component
MGLGPMMAIFQARFMRYLEHRGLVPATDRKVWAFLGDGEMDEPESMGALTMPVREKLDNLIFVINCNLQRLDGPVRGNGKIIQELEAAFLGAGWNVIKVFWGSRWDPLLARDQKGLLKRLMEECVDGEYQNFKSKGGAYTREHFFGKYPELKEMVANMSDEEIWHLNRGGHDPQKVHAAYAAAVAHKGSPTVILAKTVKGFGLGKAARGSMVGAPAEEARRRVAQEFRDRFNIQITDEEIHGLVVSQAGRGQRGDCAICRARRARHSAAICRRKLDGADPDRAAARGIQLAAGGHRRARDIDHDGLRAHSDGAGQGQEHRQAHRADRARRGAHLRHGRHVPPDRHLLLGRPAVHAAGCGSADVLPRGQTGSDSRGGHQRGGLAVFVARRRDRYANHGVSMVPFYIYYSMFGFQRVGDFIWAAGDMPRARIPGRRHGRAHDAGRRGFAASGRSQPIGRDHGAQLRRLRPDLRL